MPTPSHVASTSGTETTLQTTLTISTPAGQPGDILIGVVAVQIQGLTITQPSGWTQIDHHSGANTVVQSAYKVCDGTEAANYTWTYSVATTSAGGIARYRFHGGVHKNAVQAVASGDPQSKPTPSVTTELNGCLLIGYAGMDSTNAQGAGTWSPDGGATERVDVQETGDFTTVTIYDLPQTTAGAQSLSSTYSIAGSSSTGAGIIALAPGSSYMALLGVGR